MALQIRRWTLRCNRGDIDELRRGQCHRGPAFLFSLPGLGDLLAERTRILPVEGALETLGQPVARAVVESHARPSHHLQQPERPQREEDSGKQRNTPACRCEGVSTQGWMHWQKIRRKTPSETSQTLARVPRPGLCIACHAGMHATRRQRSESRRPEQETIANRLRLHNTRPESQWTISRNI